MLVQQDATQFEIIQIILETPEEANRFWGLIEYATCRAQENGLDFELGNKICDFFSSEAVVPNSELPTKGKLIGDTVGKYVQDEILKQMRPGGITHPNNDPLGD